MAKNQSYSDVDGDPAGKPTDYGDVGGESKPLNHGEASSWPGSPQGPGGAESLPGLNVGHGNSSINSQGPVSLPKGPDDHTA